MSFTSSSLYLFGITTLLALTGCQSAQDQRIPLPASFVGNAEVITIKKPVMQFKDRHFEQTTPWYSAQNMAIGNGKTETDRYVTSAQGLSALNLQTTDRFTRFIWNELLGIQRRSQRQYKVSSRRDFRFQVIATSRQIANQENPVDVDCQFMHLDQVEESEREVTDKKGRATKLNDTQTSRIQSLLRCEISQNEKFWQLSVDIDQNQLPHIQLGLPISESADDFFVIEHEKTNQYLVGGQWRDSNIPFPLVSGLHFHKNDTEVAALSFEGQLPKIYLGKSNKAETNTLLFAASYALLMYDWLDKEWRQ